MVVDMRRMFFCVIVYGMLLSAGLRNIYAENWPCWRGPRGDGTSLETDVPVRWDADTHTLWKTPIPGIGHASPIVWENLVFTATSLTDSQERRRLCFAARTGLCLGQKTVLKASLKENTAITALRRELRPQTANICMSPSLTGNTSW